jgi:hypothetical protein
MKTCFFKFKKDCSIQNHTYLSWMALNCYQPSTYLYPIFIFGITIMLDKVLNCWDVQSKIPELQSLSKSSQIFGFYFKKTTMIPFWVWFLVEQPHLDNFVWGPERSWRFYSKVWSSYWIIRHTQPFTIRPSKIKKANIEKNHSASVKNLKMIIE